MIYIQLSLLSSVDYLHRLPAHAGILELVDVVDRLERNRRGDPKLGPEVVLYRLLEAFRWRITSYSYQDLVGTDCIRI